MSHLRLVVSPPDVYEEFFEDSNEAKRIPYVMMLAQRAQQQRQRQHIKNVLLAAGFALAGLATGLAVGVALY